MKSLREGDELKLNIPDVIKSEEELEAVLSEPYPETVAFMERIQGDIIILGASGKMGVSLAHTIKRACKMAGVHKRIIAVDKIKNEKLEQPGIETISCDLLVPDEVARLPLADNVIFMAGRKFGEIGSEDLTWMINTIVPYNVCRKFAGSRIVAFSTGCVYPLVSAASGGSNETDPPDPVGEYAASCLGRERVFEYFSRNKNTPTLLFRLNYAIDLRYGVLLDIAQRIYNDEPVDLSVSHANVIWQGDAVNRAILSLDHAAIPPTVLNVTGGEILCVKDLAEQFADLLGKKVRFKGKDTGKAYLSNASRSIHLFGSPRVSVARMVKWTSEWLKLGGPTLNKPTHFQVTDGQFLDKK